MEPKHTPRTYGVLTKLNHVEQIGLEWLCEREALPRAQLLRRLLVKEIRAAKQSDGILVGG